MNLQQFWTDIHRLMPPLLWHLAAFVLTLAGALLARRLLLRFIARRGRDPKSFAAVFLDTIRIPSLFWALAGTIAIRVEFADLPKDRADRAVLWIWAFVIVSLTMVVSSVLIRAIANYGERQQMPLAIAGLSRTLIRIFVYATGGVILLKNFDKDITPWLTALGVGGLAVALALQDTLANFFAGIHILVERPIFVGDLIRLENGQEGVVADIGWRTTRVRTGGRDTVVVPNTKITSGILVNYSLPDPGGAAELPLLVAHHADPGLVSAIAVEEARRVEGVLDEPPPVCLCDPGILLTHLQFKLIVHVKSRKDQGRVLSEIRMRVLARFRAEGVPLPQLETGRGQPA
jgi:small-conductance mechanosensitive channel